jgi:hypothetical protein
MIIIDNKRYRERGEEFKVLYYASAAATRDCNLRQSAGNPWQITSTILLRKYSLLTIVIYYKSVIYLLNYFIYFYMARIS